MSLVMSREKLELLAQAIVEELPNRGPKRKDVVRTVEAIVWRMRNGTPWRAIPEALGPWWHAMQSFHRWVRYGVLQRVFEKIRDLVGPDLEAAFIDGTVVRAHPKAAGADGGA